MGARSRPVVAGLITAVVGYTSSFAVVLAGLRAVGASPEQAASGLTVLCIAMGLPCVIMSRLTRAPITFAWSTPGAALLIGTGAVRGGWPAAVGAFMITGVLIGLTGLWPVLGRLIARIPPAIAQAMLAGVLLGLCLAPVRTAASAPWLGLPVIIVWLIMLRLAPRWATPAAFAVVAVIIVITAPTAPAASTLLPQLRWTTPSLSVAALIGIALPLYVVTMAAQNVPGVAVLRSYGYDVPWRPAMAFTGVGTVLGAPLGGHAVNLAAISAALAASPEADPDPRRRWIAAQTAGWAYIVLGLASGAVVAVVSLAPAGLVEAAAGLALLPTLVTALQSALVQTGLRIPAGVAFLVAAGGVSAAGVGPAFWALLAGLLCGVVLRPGGFSARRWPAPPRTLPAPPDRPSS